MTEIVDRTISDPVATFSRESFLHARSDYPLRDDARLVDDGIAIWPRAAMLKWAAAQDASLMTMAATRPH